MAAGKARNEDPAHDQQRRDVWAEAVILNLARALRGGPHECVMGVFSNSANPKIQLHESALKEGFESHLVPCRGRWIGRRLQGFGR